MAQLSSCFIQSSVDVMDGHSISNKRAMITKADKGDTVLAIHFIRGTIFGLEDKQQHGVVHL